MTGTSVLITCYNLGRYLDEALSSVQAQTRPAAEVVVVDDGSDDPLTREVLDRVRRSGLTVVSTENQGVAGARELAVRLTSAPYVVLLDADDVLDTRYLEVLAGRLDLQPDLGFVTCGLRAFGEAEYEWTPPPPTWAKTHARGGPHVSSIFRRSLWNDVGGFDPELEGYEDLDFWLSALERGFVGEVVPQPLLKYRVRKRSRYHRAIQPVRYLRAMERIHCKHPPRSASERTQLLIEKEAFLQEQRLYCESLQVRSAELNRIFERVCKNVRREEAAIEKEGRSPIDWGDLRRLEPASPVWGLDRGIPLDRRYIEEFLESHRSDIHGRVAEVKDSGYCKRFGANIDRIEVIDVNAQNPSATIIADLSVPDCLPSGSFDCIILTQTLHVIFETDIVLRNLHRALAPGGVLLCTLPSVSRVSYEDGGLEDGDFWRFTEASARYTFGKVFPPGSVEVRPRGNILVCAAFLHGLDPGEVPPEALTTDDPMFPLICLVRATKQAVGWTRNPPRHAAHSPKADGAILLYHRIGVQRPGTHSLAIETEVFREQMHWLRDHCNVLSIESLVAAAAAGELPPRALAITFDDGYLEHLTMVSPLLVALGLPATYFVNTAGVEAPTEHWWDTLERVFQGDELLPDTLDLPADEGENVPTRTSDDRALAQKHVFEKVYRMNLSDRRVCMTRLIEWSGLDCEPRGSHRMMTGDEIRNLSSEPGQTIGVHTENHLALDLQLPSVQLEEMARSKADLERLAGHPLTAFAYPYGAYTGRTVTLARQIGFTTAVTVEPRLLRRGAHPLLVPRFESPKFAVSDFSRWLLNQFGTS